jgi:hypothetical protein
MDGRQYLSLQSLLSERVLILAILVAGILIKIFITITRKKPGIRISCTEKKAIVL